jgi:DNA-directed RNA polymerase subunit alpha
MLEPIFQIKKEEETADHGLFVIEPLEQGYGHTVGNALRRVLLSSLSGAAVTQVKVSGVKHKFTTLEGMKEDIVELILNIKQIRVKYDGDKPVKLNLEKTGPGQVVAGDIESSGGAEVVNKDLILATLADKKSQLKAELVVESGYGYLPTSGREAEKLGVILVDAAFSPVTRVNYKVEATRVGRRTDLDRLILEIFTDGSIKPSEALKKSAQILIDFFTQIVKPKKMPETKAEDEAPSEILGFTLEEIEIPTRIANALRKSGYETVGDLTACTPTELAKVKNLGEKSLEVVKQALVKKGLSLKEEKNEA